MASQMWILAHLLPVMIGQYIDDDDKYWNHFLQLLDIMEYTFSPTVLPTTPAYLKVIIESNLTSYQELFPESTFTPKMHYMVHIPQYLYTYVNTLNYIYQRHMVVCCMAHTTHKEGAIYRRAETNI